MASFYTQVELNVVLDFFFKRLLPLRYSDKQPQLLSKSPFLLFLISFFSVYLFIDIEI